MNEVERFWSKVAQGSDTECWPWIGGLEPDTRYPVFYLYGGRKERGHRYSLALKLGRPLSPGALACHRCDNPPCVNPSHLYEGNARTNTADKVSAGRQMRGSKSGNTRLTEADVRAIRDLYAAGGVSQGDLGQRFRVSQSEVCRMVNRKSWRHA